MRKIATTIIALGLGVATTQPVLAQQVSLGVRGGFNSTTASWEGGVDEIETDWKSDYHIGALASLRIHELIDLRLEAWYTRKGTGAAFVAEPAEGQVSLEYLEVPVLAVLTIPTGPGTRLKPHVFAGPTLAFELDCTSEAYVNGLPIEGSCDDPDIGIERHETDIGLLFGFGLEIAAGKGAIFFDAAYDLGLTNLNDAPEEPNLTVKNRTIMVSAGYLFRMGG
jgi:hypothetical protein